MAAAAASAAAPLPSLDWIRLLPKVEMHAHLSGSVNDASIRRLLAEEAAEKGAALTDELSSTVDLQAASCVSTFTSGDRSLVQCFEVFALLHRLLSNLPAVAQIAREVIEDFARDGVVYLELRTGPRAMKATAKHEATTKKQFVETIVRVIREAEETVRTPSGEKICVRLLLSIDRSGSQENAASTIDLAGEFASQPNPVVVGLDFSGNPLSSSFRAFQHHFVRARQQFGLKCSIHVGEKVDDADDLDAVLFDFKPERIGHVVCLEERHTEHLLAFPCPIEICPTSNLKTQIVQTLTEHPFGTWRARGRNNNASSALSGVLQLPPYPLVVCTDDSGVFNLTLSSELADLARAFNMDAQELFELERRALEHAFVDEAEKVRLREVFARFATKQQADGSSASSSAAVSAAAAPVASSAVSSDSRPIAILTCDDDLAWKGSDRALLAAFAAAGVPAKHAVWDDPAEDWKAYRAVVIRSTWNYHLHVDAFLAVLQRIEAAGVPLLNRLSTVRWNASKRYLRELREQHSVPTVDTIWIDGGLQSAEEQQQLAAQIREQGWSDCVIKPQVSASGHLTARFMLDPTAAASDAAAPASSAVSTSAAAPIASFSSVISLCAASGVRGWMVQPFMREVLTEGERSFVFLNGAYSHTVLATPAAAAEERHDAPAWRDELSPEPVCAKTAAASPTGFMVQGSNGGSFRYIQPDAELIAQARAFLHATDHGRSSLYARVDCLRRGDRLLLTELELIEPELFGRGVDGFQQKFVEAILKRIQQ